jgi:phage gp45-like
MSWEAAIARVAGRVRLSIGRVVLGLVNDAAKLQAVQVTLRADEVRAGAEHFQHYGFTSVPLPGAEGIALAVGGSTDHVVVINVDDRRYRKKGLLPGETCLYTKWGDYILIREGEIVVKHATKVVIDAPLVEITGNVTVAGTVVAQGDVVGLGTSLHGHTHQEQGDGAPTSPPI